MQAQQSNRRNLGIQDAAFKQTDKRVQQLEAYQARVKDYCDRELCDAHFIERNETSVANAERQRGNALSYTVLEDWLKIVAPSVMVLRHPSKPDIVNLYQSRAAAPWERDPLTGQWGGNQRTHLMAANVHMPEWTIMTKNKVEQPLNLRHVDGHYGTKETEIPWREDRRGWRTVLAILLRRGVVSQPEVEKFVTRYGSSRESKSWHGLMNMRATRL